MQTLTVGSLFSGYGGLDLGLSQVLPTELLWVVDNAPGPQKILAHRYPNASNLGDITAIDWATVPKVSVITGGSPCQDISVAGKGAGIQDGTRSGLWAYMRKAIEIVKPEYVFWENVANAKAADAYSRVEPCPGCVGNPTKPSVLRALGRVLGDLASCGYDARWQSVRASDIGFCHHRARIFVWAWRRGLAGPIGASTRPGGEGRGSSLRTAATGYKCLATPHAGLGENSRVTHYPARVEKGQQLGLHGQIALIKASYKGWGPYEAAIRSHEKVLGREHPVPTVQNKNDKPELNPEFVEWVMGLEKGWITDIPEVSKKEALTALGNGVVPAQAAYALKLLIGETSA